MAPTPEFSPETALVPKFSLEKAPVLEKSPVKTPTSEHCLIMALAFVWVWAAHTIVPSPKPASAAELSQEATQVPKPAPESS